MRHFRFIVKFYTHDIFTRAYERGDTVVQFQCANEAVFEQVAGYLLEEQHIFDFVNTLDAVPYYDNPETDTFCFWLLSAVATQSGSGTNFPGVWVSYNLSELIRK